MAKLQKVLMLVIGVIMAAFIVGCNNDQSETIKEITDLKQRVIDLETKLSELSSQKTNQHVIPNLKDEIINNIEFTKSEDIGEGVAILLGYTTPRSHTYSYELYRVDREGKATLMIPNVSDGGGHFEEKEGQVVQYDLYVRMEHLKHGEQLILRIHELGTGRLAEFSWEGDF
jgi:hypothetical protein